MKTLSLQGSFNVKNNCQTLTFLNSALLHNIFCYNKKSKFDICYYIMKITLLR